MNMRGCGWSWDCHFGRISNISQKKKKNTCKRHIRKETNQSWKPIIRDM